jgi:membrane-associated protease RseP (regulator of RpoE activity)
MSSTKKRVSPTPNAHYLLGCTLLMAVSGCSSMDIAKYQLDSYCTKRGEHPFMKEAKQTGIPVVLDFGSTIVAVCYSDEEIGHFPDLGIDVIPLGESKCEKGVGIVSVSSHSIAGRAGLRVGDIVAGYGGQATATPADLRAAVDAAAAGGPVTVKFPRGMHDLTVALPF